MKQDIANLSIHLRTLLTINRDIPNRATGLKLVEQYRVDGVMIGRGIFTNPFAFEIEPKELNIQKKPGHVRLNHFFAFSKSMFVDLEAQAN